MSEPKVGEVMEQTKYDMHLQLSRMLHRHAREWKEEYGVTKLKVLVDRKELDRLKRATNCTEQSEEYLAQGADYPILLSFPAEELSVEVNYDRLIKHSDEPDTVTETYEKLRTIFL